MNFRKRNEFLTFTTLFLFVMLLIAAALAALAGLHPLESIAWSWRDAGIGAGAAVLMVALFSQVRPVREQAEAILGPSLAACRWYDLLLMAVFVGVVEELLFRGVLEPWVARWHPVGAFIIVNVLFGALHSVSLSYAVVATLLGCILSLLAHGLGTVEFNLLRPMVAHAVYDYIGFLWIASSSSRGRGEASSHRFPSNRGRGAGS